MKLKIYSYEGQDYPKAEYLNVSEKDISDFINRARTLDVSFDYPKYRIRVTFRSGWIDVRHIKPSTQPLRYAGLRAVTNMNIVYHDSTFGFQVNELKLKLDTSGSNF
jgi:hypothetical protein